VLPRGYGRAGRPRPLKQAAANFRNEASSHAAQNCTS